MSTRFRIFSDLHLEFYKGKIPSLPKGGADYLILAGDIVTGYKAEETLALFMAEHGHLYKNVFYVLGNHEFYYSRDDGVTMRALSFTVRYYREICENLGIVMLENEMVTTDEGISLWGATFWADYSLKALDCMNDTWHVRGTEILDRHSFSVEALERVLAEKAPDIVITHHLPSYELVNEKYDRDREGVSSGFASDSDRLIRGMKHWVYGHTHHRGTKEINGVNLVANPLGYPGELKEAYEDVIVTV